MDTDLDVSHLFNLEQLLTGRFEHEYLEYTLIAANLPVISLSRLKSGSLGGTYP